MKVEVDKRMFATAFMEPTNETDHIIGTQTLGDANDTGVSSYSETIVNVYTAAVLIRGRSR